MYNYSFGLAKRLLVSIFGLKLHSTLGVGRFINSFEEATFIANKRQMQIQRAFVCKGYHPGLCFFIWFGCHQGLIVIGLPLLSDYVFC